MRLRKLHDWAIEDLVTQPSPDHHERKEMRDPTGAEGVILFAELSFESREMLGLFDPQEAEVLQDLISISSELTFDHHKPDRIPRGDCTVVSISSANARHG